MYALIRRYEGIPNVKEAAHKVSHGFVPLISQHPGFISFIVVDSGGGVLTSITVFLSQADAEESTAKTADWMRQNLAPLLPNPPQITTGEVLAYKK
jgi:hypothetical protein